MIFFKNIFVRQVKALYSKNEMFITLSLSGDSNNNINPFKFFKKNKIKSILFTGSKKSQSLNFCYYAKKIPSKIKAFIEKCYICIYHSLCEMLEQNIV